MRGSQKKQPDGRKGRFPFFLENRIDRILLDARTSAGIEAQSLSTSVGGGFRRACGPVGFSVADKPIGNGTVIARCPIYVTRSSVKAGANLKVTAATQTTMDADLFDIGGARWTWSVRNVPGPSQR
jgi:hypothetical protein